MRIVELTINELEGAVVNKISLVNDPAIESDFMYFNSVCENINLKPTKFELSKVDTEQRIITGAALIPNKMILRVDDFGEPYQIYFGKSTVKEISQVYLKNYYTHNVNLEHSEDVEDVFLIETWIVDDPECDKAKSLGFSVPKGTWMVSLKVQNQTVWEEFVKTGLVKGFSIEGYFIKANRQYFDKKLINVERWVLGKTDQHCEQCQEISQRRNSNGGVFFTKGTLPTPPVHEGCKCRVESKSVKDNPKNYK